MPPVTYDLSPQQAADLLGVHVETLKRWARAGKVPGWRTPGGWWRFSTDELTAWQPTSTEIVS